MEIEMPVVEMPEVEAMQVEIALGFEKMQELRAQGKPVVWRSLLVPREIFMAMDVPTVYGDLLGGNIGVFGQSGKYCQIAEEKGLSRTQSYDLVQAAASRVWESDLNFKDVLINDSQIKSHLSAREIEGCFDINYYLRHVEQIFKKVGL